MSNKNHFTANQFIAAIKGSGGIVTTIAKRVGCDWHTAKKYIDTMPTVKRAYDAEWEGILDLTEAKLIEQINSGELGAIKYMLSTKGKQRGYTERHEIQQQTVNLSDLTDSQLQRLAAGEEMVSVLADK